MSESTTETAEEYKIVIENCAMVLSRAIGDGCDYTLADAVVRAVQMLKAKRMEASNTIIQLKNNAVTLKEERNKLKKDVERLRRMLDAAEVEAARCHAAEKAMMGLALYVAEVDPTIR